MNKYQRAKDILELYGYSTKLELVEGHRNRITDNITLTEFEEMKDVCLELLDKETPMKPNGLKCGKCGSWVAESTYTGIVRYHRCRKLICEQKIDWSEDNEL